MGHTVKLMAPQFVKPYVKTNKHDAADAEAICEAVRRPGMRFVPVKNVAQQAVLALHRVRQGWIKARTAQANQIRGLLSEFGLIVPRGIGHITICRDGWPSCLAVFSLIGAWSGFCSTWRSSGPTARLRKRPTHRVPSAARMSIFRVGRYDGPRTTRPSQACSTVAATVRRYSNARQIHRQSEGSGLGSGAKSLGLASSSDPDEKHPSHAACAARPLSTPNALSLAPCRLANLTLTAKIARLLSPRTSICRT